MSSTVLPEGSLSVKERRQLLLQKGLAIGEQQESKPTTITPSPRNNNNSSASGRSSSIHKKEAIAPPSSNHPTITEPPTDAPNNNNSNTTKTNSGETTNFSSIKDRIKLLDNKPQPPPLPIPSSTTNSSTIVKSQTLVPMMMRKDIPQPPPSSSSETTTAALLSHSIDTNREQQQPFIPPPPASLFSYDQIKELHRDEYEEFEYQLKQTELELDSNNTIPINTGATEQVNNINPNIPSLSSAPFVQHSHNDDNKRENTSLPTNFQQEMKNPSIWNNNPMMNNKNYYSSNNTSDSIGKERLPPIIRSSSQNINNNVIGVGGGNSNVMMSKERKNSINNNNNNNTIGGAGGGSSGAGGGLYHYPIQIQSSTATVVHSDEVQYPSAPSYDEIDFPEYQVVNSQLQTMTNNIFKPITDSVSSEVSEEDNYQMFTQFKEFIKSQNVGVNNEEELYSLYISFRERYQQQQQHTAQTNVNISKQQPNVVQLVNKSRVPSSSPASTKSNFLNPNSPTISTSSSVTSSSSTVSSNSSGQEKKRDALKNVRKKYEEQKLEEMRIKQMKERNKAHFSQAMQQPCTDYNALVMRENNMYNNNVQPNAFGVDGGVQNNNYPLVNNPNDMISNGTYIPFNASHPQTNSHVTTRAISNSTGGNYPNYNYWPKQ